MKEAIIEFFIRGWGKRQIMKGLTLLATVIGANTDDVAQVTAFVVAGLIYLTEMAFSKLAKRRLEQEAEAAKLESVANQQG